MICKLVLGDMFSDGHSITKDIIINSNYDNKVLWEAYKESCNELGIQFNSPVNDFTGLGLNENHDNRALWHEYGDISIHEKEFNILDKAGCLKGISLDEDDYEIEGDEYNFYNTKVAAKLIMNFISLSMPKDFKYEFIEDYPVINNECAIGYGLLEY